MDSHRNILAKAKSFLRWCCAKKKWIARNPLEGARDLDDGGKLLWIPDSKTEAGRRTLQVPDLLQPYLRALAEGKSPEAKLFGDHWRDWVRKWVQRMIHRSATSELIASGSRLPEPR